MKHEWRKHEKEIYIPKKIPVQITLPPLNYFMIKGKGNPNDPSFAEYVGVLYSLSYGVRMSIKKGIAPDDYNEYTVYPLEGIWDISDKAKQENSGVLDKDELVFF